MTSRAGMASLLTSRPSLVEERMILPLLISSTAHLNSVNAGLSTSEAGWALMSFWRDLMNCLLTEKLTSTVFPFSFLFFDCSVGALALVRAAVLHWRLRWVV